MAPSTTVSRRSFLALAGALPFALRASALAAGKVPVGLELYTVRDELTKDLLGTVRAVGKMGYEVVEFYSPYFRGRRRRRRKSASCSTTSASMPFDAQRFVVADGREPAQKAIELNQIIGSQVHHHGQPGRA